MRDMKELMKEHYIKYASYVILDRAIPELTDGLKPVQRRILYTLFRMNDNMFHKVANVTGQTMALHPHGDAPIYEALVALANKGFLLDCQGNFGNTMTGDPAAASRYIESRLSKLALETCFNPKLTEMVPSYDGRQVEPVAFPMKLPLLLLQGADGIAVGMSTKILPHNFNEVLQAQIEYLQGKPFELFPDFPSGGICDASLYQSGKGKVRVRAKIEIPDQKRLVIRELPFGTTTESVISSIEEAVKKGKIKIDSIHDYTSQNVEIEITLPRGVYAKDVEEQLYGFTDCQVSITPIMVVIKDNNPCEVSVEEAVAYQSENLKIYLKKELELTLQEIREKVFFRKLEEIFIEEKIYKRLEDVEKYEMVFEIVEKAFYPFIHLLERAIQKEDLESLLAIPIRRIARFDREKNRKEIEELIKTRKLTEKSLTGLTAYTISFLENLLKKYGALFPRKTVLQSVEEVDKKQIELKSIEVHVDFQTGYIGTKVPGNRVISCTNFDKLLVFYNDGSYRAVSIEDKEYVGKEKAKIIHVMVADKTTALVCMYTDKETGLTYCKRFIVKQFLMQREYRYMDEGAKLLVLTEKVEAYLVRFVPKLRQKMSAIEFNPDSVAIKGVSAHGVRIASRPCLSIEPLDSAKK